MPLHQVNHLTRHPIGSIFSESSCSRRSRHRHQETTSCTDVCWRRHFMAARFPSSRTTWPTSSCRVATFTNCRAATGCSVNKDASNAACVSTTRTLRSSGCCGESREPLHTAPQDTIFS